jgi:hypothetical protein
MKTVPTYLIELRHNDEALGRLSASDTVESIADEVLHAEARFWMGLCGLRRPMPRRRAVRRFRLLASHA